MKKVSCFFLFIFIFSIQLIFASCFHFTRYNIHKFPDSPANKKNSDGWLSPLAAENFIEGEIELIKGNGKGAAEAFSRALLIDPDNPLIMSRYALSLALEGKKSKAIETFEKILRQYPDDESTLLLYAQFKEDNAKWEEAEKIYKILIKKYPDSEEAYLNLAKLLLKLNRIQDACNLAEKLIEIHPDLPEGHLLAAEIAFTINDLYKSRMHLNNFIKVVPLIERKNRWKVLLEYAKKFQEKSKFDYSLFLIENYRREYPSDLEAIKLQVELLLHLDRIAEARELARCIKTDEPAAAAQIMYEAGEYKEASSILIENLNPINQSNIKNQHPLIKLIILTNECFKKDTASVKEILKSFNPFEKTWKIEALEKISSILISSGLKNEMLTMIFSEPEIEYALQNWNMLNTVSIAISGTKKKEIERIIPGELKNSNSFKLLDFWVDFINGKENAAQKLESKIENLDSQWSVNSPDSIKTIKCILIGEKLIGKKTDMFELIAEIEKNNPASDILPLIKARLFFLVGNMERAKIWFDRAKTYYHYLRFLWESEFLLKQGKTQEAKQQIFKGLRANPPDYFLHRLLSLL